MHLQTGVRAPIGERIEREVVFARATCGYSALAFFTLDRIICLLEAESISSAASAAQ